MTMIQAFLSTLGFDNTSAIIMAMILTAISMMMIMSAVIIIMMMILTEIMKMIMTAIV